MSHQTNRHIIAISGRAFALTPSGSQSLFDYAVSQARQQSHQSSNQSPSQGLKIGLLNQAVAEDPTHNLFFQDMCSYAGAHATIFSLFGRVRLPELIEEILEQDLIFVSGGNTLSMLALWRAYDLDQVLYQAYQKGCVIAGVSAGAICWFEQAISDSLWPLIRMDGLGWVKGSMCGHYDSEPERRPTTLAARKSGQLMDGFALEDFTAIHFVNEEPQHLISSKAGQKIYRIDEEGEHLLPIKLI